jgi:hypothetical protein
MRFHFYASRVRGLFVRPEDTGAKEDIFQTLSIHRREIWLFPNLLNLEWAIEDAARFPYVTLFLGPRLESFQFFVGDSIHIASLRSVVQTLTYECPGLRSLTVLQLNDVELSAETLMTLKHDLSTLIMNTNSLGRCFVNIPGLVFTPGAIKHLATMPHLHAILLPLTSTDIDLVASEWSGDPTN